jgi:hypothetical protein
LSTAAYSKFVIMLADLKKGLGVKINGLCTNTTTVPLEWTVSECMM